MAIKCLQCKNETVVEGIILNQPDYVAPKAYFRPKGLPFYAVFGTNVLMENTFYSCKFCGFLWSKIDTARLSAVTSRSSNPYGQKSQVLKDNNVYELDKG